MTLASIMVDPSRRVLAVLVLACAMLPVHAQRATIAPSPAEVYDLVTLQFDAGQAICPLVMQDGLRMDGQTIGVFYQRIGDCSFGPFASMTLTLGRFPAGDYSVVVYEAPPTGSLAPIRIVAQTSFHVNAYGFGQGGVPKLRENYTGHWTTDFWGEAVTIAQSGNRAVATWLTYAADGKPTWYVIPGFSFGPDPVDAFRFFGFIYAAQGAPTTSSPFAAFASAARVGDATLDPIGPDRATLQLRFSGGPVVNRTLTRMRF